MVVTHNDSPVLKLKPNFLTKIENMNVVYVYVLMVVDYGILGWIEHWELQD